MSRTKTRISVLLALFLLPGASQAIAEEERSQVIEEIVVTAQKREQNLTDVGIAVTAFAGNDVRELRLTQPKDLAAQTPNLNINDTFQNQLPNVSIRGLGLNDYAVNNNPAAGVYIDEVYLVSPAMLSFQLFDMERVEVLKGPQGTLYGRNTTAGTVNFVSAKPTMETDGYLSIDVGDFDLFALEGAIGGSLSDTLSARVAIQTTQQGEGHMDNRATGDDVGEVDRTSWRLMFNWVPSDEVDVLLNIHGGRDQSDTWLIKVDNLFTAEDDAFFPGDRFSSAGRSDTDLDNESEGASLTVNWDISETWSLTSVTGYEQYERHHVEDRDGSALIQLDGEYMNDIDQFTQELRFAYTSETLSLILGAFYGTDEVQTRDRFDTPDLGFGFFSVGNEFTQETDSAALFIHSEWLVGENLNLTVGLRYTDEEKEFGDAFTFFYFDALPSDGGTEVQAFAPVANDYDVTDLSGKIGIDYHGLENTLLYASISNGFKSGSFQGQLAFDPANLTGFDEENVWAYEIGSKSTLRNGSMQLNAAIFFYDYEDVQVYGPIFDSPVGPLFGIDNAGDAEVYGGEIELLWLAAPGLEIRTGLGLLDTEVTDSILPGVAEGSELPNAPETNFNFNLRYEWQIGDKLIADVILDTSYKDDVSYDVVRAPVEAREDGYWLTNVRLGVTSSTGKWAIHAWGRNLTDEEYRTQVLTSTVGFGETWGFPRTYGVTLDFNI